VAFFLQPSADTANGTQLYTLYMRQRLLVPYNATGSQSQYTLTGLTNLTDYVEISGSWSPQASPYQLNCNRPIDVTMPPRRFGMNPYLTTPPVGSPAPSTGGNTSYAGQLFNTDSAGNLNYPTLQQDFPGSASYSGMDVLLTDVVSFEVRVLPQGWSDFADVFDMANSGQWSLNNPAFYNPSATPARNSPTYPMVFDTWSQMPSPPDTTYDYSQWKTGDATNKGSFDAIPMWDSTNNTGPILKAIQITLRVWDLKSEMTRQVTFVVPL
jgi:hypothetical protein